MLRLYVDMDNTLVDCHDRWIRNSYDKVLLPSAFSEDEVMSDSPMLGALSAMQAFSAAGWSLAILTARGYDRDGRITSAWLDKFMFPSRVVVVVPGGEHKPSVLIRDKPDLFIDDFMGAYETGLPRFASRVYEACRVIVPTEVYRNNWDEIVQRYLG